MKKMILISVVTLMLMSACNQSTNKESNVEPNTTAITMNFDWLLGEWKRIDEEEGKETYENWEKKNDSEYLGIGFTMQNNDTIKQERIRLIALDDKWALEVQPQDEPQPITFVMTSHNNKEFVCENEELDFPKMIKYWKNEDKLSALVSGDEMEIHFDFERISNN